MKENEEGTSTRHIATVIPTHSHSIISHSICMFSTVNNNGMSKKYRLRLSIIKLSSIVTTHLLVLQRQQTNKRVFNLNVGVILVSMLLLRMARALSNQYQFVQKKKN